MIKHFCDICGNEMTQRIRIYITAKEVFGEAYVNTLKEEARLNHWEFIGE